MMPNKDYRTSKMITTRDLPSQTNRLNADQIYRIMTQIKNGISLTVNPTSFTNKIIDSQDPIIKLRQNKNNQLEVVSPPMPIAKVNNLSPFKIDEIRSIIMSINKKLPPRSSNIAFADEKVTESVMGSKLFSNSCGSYDKDEGDDDKAIGSVGGGGGGGRNGNNFVYKIMVSHLKEEQIFAVNPMQVGKWFPGMLTVYSD